MYVCGNTLSLSAAGELQSCTLCKYLLAQSLEYCGRRSILSPWNTHAMYPHHRYPNQSLKEVGERELSVIKKKVPRETASPTSSTDEGPAGAPGLKPVLQGG